MKDGYHGEVSDPPPDQIPAQLGLPVSDAPFSIQTCICCPRTVQEQFLQYTYSSRTVPAIYVQFKFKFKLNRTDRKRINPANRTDRKSIAGLI